ncbi:MAG: RNA methyltransferase substrate-binding domain-containing protein, partial [Eubacteriales bacterium]|nr:RNA methyltransferase substrate-binding domain-containing protein [Eubacteriales bacterium]
MDNSSSSKSGFAGKGKYSGQKKTFGSKKTSGDKRTFGDKESFGDKKAFGDKAGYKGKRPASVQQRQGFKPFRNKPADNSGRDRFRKPYTDERPFSKADEAGILEGRNPVMEALKSGRSINRIIISSGDREGSINKILAIARE